MAPANEIKSGEKTRDGDSLEGRSRRALVLILLLVAITGMAIGMDMLAWKGRKAEQMRIFQKATGGLGMGAIATPLWQFINYDARILSVDDSITWPIPGGYSYGPDRTGTVSYFREIPEDHWAILPR
jgi:hypothetical protein